MNKSILLVAMLLASCAAQPTPFSCEGSPPYLKCEDGHSAALSVAPSPIPGPDVPPPTEPEEDEGKGNNGHGNGNDDGSCQGQGCSDETNPGRGLDK